MKFSELKASELISYVVFGFLTTVISLAVYYVLVFTILDAKITWQLQIANVISWIFGVVFAFVTNRIFVFKSKSKNIYSELFKFFFCQNIFSSFGYADYVFVCIACRVQ